jgi:hypothetical protein
LTAFFSGLLGLLDPVPALAQLPQTTPPRRAVPATPEESARDASILRRGHADKPEGLAIGGGFLFLPKIEFETEYDTNVFRTRNNRQDDFIFRLRPSFAINSDWGEHALGFSASAELGRYADLSSENYEAFALAASGKLDINEELAWTNDAEFARTALPRGAPGLFGSFSGRRQIVHVISASSQLLYGGDPFFGRIGPRFRRVEYVRGVTFDEDFNIYEIGARLGYKVTPDLSVFVDPSYQWVRYDRNVDAGGTRRNNQGFDIRLGAAYDIGRDLTAEAGVGYFRRTFDGPGKPTDGVSFLARLFWNPTDNVSVESEARRAFTQYRVATGTASALANAVETYFGARIGWEPIEPMLIDAGASYARYTFSGTGVKENYVFFDVGAKYFFNPHLYAGPRYFFERRFAKPSALGYTDNRFMLTLGAQW